MRIYTQDERLRLITDDRRALHRIPECGYDLPKTRAYITKALSALEPEVLEPCDEGIKAVFRARIAQRGAIAFRSDMDALYIDEHTGCDYASEHCGKCHACGHDGHMAAMLMLARIVAGQRESLDRDVVFLFQPAEENLGGGKRMVDAGAMVNPVVDEVYGMHIMPTLPLGTIGCRAGAMMATVDTFEIDIEGKAAHGATPHLGNDAIMALSHFILNIQAAMKRRISPQETSVFTIGGVKSGEVYNVISDHAHLLGNMRSYSEEVRAEMFSVLKDTLAASDLLYRTKSTLNVLHSYPAVINDADCVEKVAACAGESYRTIEPVTISEDFSEFERVAPGAYFFCGCADEEHSELLHSDKFNFDERALLKGVEVFEKLIGFGGVQ